MDNRAIFKRSGKPMIILTRNSNYENIGTKETLLFVMGVRRISIFVILGMQAKFWLKLEKTFGAKFPKKIVKNRGREMSSSFNNFQKISSVFAQNSFILTKSSNFPFQKRWKFGDTDSENRQNSMTSRLKGVQLHPFAYAHDLYLAFVVLF